MQLITTNLAGNLHSAAATINSMGLADFLVTISSSGSATIAVLRVPDDIAPKVRRHLGMMPEYCANPKPAIDWARQ